MKTATLLWTSLFVLATSTGYSQATAAANSAAQTSATAGRSAVSGSSAGSAEASATRNQIGSTGSDSSAVAAQAGKTSTAAAQTSNVAAELTQKVNSKNAKAGDQVVARTTSTAQLAEGTKLPKGTRLVGKVTEVQPKSSVQHDGHLAFTFDRAVLRDGREIPIHATLQSISAPAAASAMAGGSDDFAVAPTPIAISGGDSARAGGGLLGGGAAVPRTGLVSGAASTAAAPARAAGTTSAVTHTAGSTLGNAVNQGTSVMGQTAATVSNLPGLSASSSASGSSMLDASGSNVDLSSGTQMTFAVAAQ